MHAPEADRHRALGGAARLEAYVQVAGRQLRGLQPDARSLERRAARALVGFERGVPRLELAGGRARTLELRPGARQRRLSRGVLACQLGAPGLEPLAAFTGVDGAQAAGIECPQELRVLALRLLHRAPAPDPARPRPR